MFSFVFFCFLLFFCSRRRRNTFGTPAARKVTAGRALEKQEAAAGVILLVLSYCIKITENKNYFHSIFSANSLRLRRQVRNSCAVPCET